MKSISLYLNENPNLIVIIVWSTLVNCSLGAWFNPLFIATNVALILLLSNLTKTVTAAIVLIFSLLALLLFPVVATYGKPNINMVSAMLYANHEELLTTVKNLHLWWVIPGVTTLILGIAIIKKINTPLKLSRRVTLYMLIFSAAAIFLRPTFAYTERGFMYEIKYPPFSSLENIYDSVMLIKKTNLTIAEGKTKKTDFIKTTLKNTHYDTFIMVIDESVRRDYMNIYGAPINDTPFLSSSPGIFFDRYVSSSFATVPSLTHSLIRNINNHPEYNNSVIRLAQNVGLKTYWLSNQGFYGFYDSPVAVIGMQADHYFFTKKGNSRIKDFMPDTLLLPEIKKALSNMAKKLVIIHLIGSHTDFCKRVNNHSEFRLHGRENSCYAQSIKNTDRLLQRITTMATDDGDKWSMLYFSDHGLSHSPLTGDLTYRDSKKENFSPPFAVINYDSKQQEHITALRSGLDFEAMFSQWIGVDEPMLKRSCDYFSQDECLKRPEVYDGDLKQEDYLSLADDPPRY